MNYKINNIEVSKEQIKELIKNNPELLEDIKVSGKYFFPKEKRAYWHIDEMGYVGCDEMCADEIDLERIEQGVFETQEEAELARDKQKAIVACWKWAQENASFEPTFEPDWGNTNEYKYYVYYNFNSKKLVCSCVDKIKTQFTLPYFKSQEDCIKFIEANKANLELLFTK